MTKRKEDRRKKSGSNLFIFCVLIVIKKNVKRQLWHGDKLSDIGTTRVDLGPIQ